MKKEKPGRADEGKSLEIHDEDDTEDEMTAEEAAVKPTVQGWKSMRGLQRKNILTEPVPIRFLQKIPKAIKRPLHHPADDIEEPLDRNNDDPN